LIPLSTETSYRVAPYRGKPTIFANNQPQAVYAYSFCGEMHWPGAVDIYQKFAAHGCHYYVLCLRGGVGGDWETTPFWTDVDVYPEYHGDAAAAISLAVQAQAILKLDPDAQFFVRCNTSPPKLWRDRYPDERLLNCFGHRYTETSLASDLFLAGMERFLENLVRYCEQQPWAARILGYLVYPLGEGTTQLSGDGFLFDVSAPVQTGFRAFLQRKYATDAALQEAWGRTDVTLATVRPPDDRDFRSRGETDYAKFTRDSGNIKRIPHRLHWPEPAEIADVKDYCWYMRELTERNFRMILQAVKRVTPHKLAGLDAYKQTMLGWPLVARWVGDYQSHAGSMHPVSGAFAMAELLDIPDLNIVCTPHDYLHRGMGFGYEGEGIGDSITLHGKMMLMEEDQRSFSNSEGESWNWLKDRKEAAAGLWRNFGAAIARGYNTYPMDVCNASYFMDDGIQEILAARRQVYESAIHWPHTDVSSVVMIVDDTSVIEEDLTLHYQNLAVIQQRLYGLSRCGVPFRLHLFEDLYRDDFPACHRVFLFPNLFKITPERLAVLKQKVLRNGHVAIFGPASGITDGKALSAESASELTGIPLVLNRRESPRVVTIDRFDHPVTAALRERVDFGDSFAYGPLLVPQEDSAVRRLGGIQWPMAKDGAGLVIREFGQSVRGRGPGDYASVFSCAVPLPAVLLRELARYSGTHVYGEGDDLVFADNCTLTVHSMRPGRRVIKLPRASTVWDVITRQKLGEQLTELMIDVDPPQTRMFFFGERL